MEKIELSPEQALEEHKKNAEKFITVFKDACEKFSGNCEQIRKATAGELIPHFTYGSISALADSIGFLESVINGKEVLDTPAPRILIPKEFKAVSTASMVNIIAPSFKNDKLVGEWISSELLPALSELWGEGKKNVAIRGIASADQDDLVAIEFKYNGEAVQLKAGQEVIFQSLDTPNWIKVLK
jgi:hypothetical protein